MKSLGYRRKETDRILVAARELQDPSATQDAAGPLALGLYAAEGFCRSYYLALQEEERIVVGGKFLLTPLIHSLRFDVRFHALELTRGSVRLLEVTREAVAPLELPPEFSRIGPGSDRDSECAFVRRIADAFGSHIRGDRVPLVLAAPDRLQRLFRDAYRDPYLVEESIGGVTDRLEDRRLLEEGWTLVEPWLRRNLELACRRFRDLRHTGRTSEDPEEILKRAYEGAVDTVFVTKETEGALSGDGSVNLILEKVLCAEGDVYVVSNEDFPGSSGGALAAVFRS